MKLLAGLALASLAAAVPVMEKRATVGLDVELQMQGNSKVKAVITNNGQNSLKVLKSGTFLDTSAVEKAQVFSANGVVPFDGVRVNMHMASLTDAAFQRIASGESIEVDFDVAELHDLSTGGSFGILTSGALSFAEENSTNLIGSVPFHSNFLTATVDGEQAYAVRTAFTKKRSAIQSDCTGDRLTSTYASLGRCAGLAQAAQQAAESGPDDKMIEYFKSASSETRSTVAGVFSRVAAECGSTDSGNAKFYCSDVYGACSDGVLAYTVPGLNYMAYCDLFFTALSIETTTCHGQEQGTTVVHEATHLSQIKGTSDYGGYGYDFLRSLTAAEDLNHADTYALFANAINLSC
ncbi:Deuterolysin metalloprotease family-domain-containing protein [Dactylonectria estremocensis]|uniref:Neutral protease 2 n=1 Tax=Dactylonectria estremocensis TaxID=1079267 RepID=A0A9P9JAZ3_9HYPO|nr:Deuterolysin metalloprotease family-domain-containing protein [Dactylonectria estremocensis]